MSVIESENPVPFGPKDFQEKTGASDAVMARLVKYDEALLEASRHHNLIARSTIEHRWFRHYYDSAQLLSLLPPGAQSILDLGSGAGFPGLVLAAFLNDTDSDVIMIESVGKKARFLMNAVTVMGLDHVSVHMGRAEHFVPPQPPTVITARALASLDKLLNYAERLGGRGTVCIFPKGMKAGDELTEAGKSWHMDMTISPSLTSAQAQIVMARNIRRR